MKSAALRCAVLALAAVAMFGLAACEPKPSTPPKPTTTHIEVPVNGEARPVDLRLMT